MRGRIIGLAWLALLSFGCGAPKPAITAAAANEPASPQMQAVEIVVYGTDWCPVCARARGWLEAGQYRYRWLDVDTDVKASVRHRWLNPRGSVPTFEVAGRAIIGFDGPTLRDAVVTAAGEAPPATR
ncbi:MAG: glutaredoxin family protein [Deltaproteobacteria bacterium]|nr:glutaredoxin family protein [Deltaproteobacteria bacterium]